MTLKSELYFATWVQPFDKNYFEFVICVESNLLDSRKTKFLKTETVEFFYKLTNGFSQLVSKKARLQVYFDKKNKK